MDEDHYEYDGSHTGCGIAALVVCVTTMLVLFTVIIIKVM